MLLRSFFAVRPLLELRVLSECWVETCVASVMFEVRRALICYWTYDSVLVVNVACSKPESLAFVSSTVLNRSFD